MASEKKWHPKFIEYMEKIVNNPNYKGIPYKRNNKGQIAWIAPKVGEMKNFMKDIILSLVKKELNGF